ncbi:hypothetical protein SD427_13865 [Chryseobacterium sp. JJR-5R]|uniref:hypothetical protein n=1 Tax=Chryseobacterium sp. JJR-5R TaxID=3093923 RepID=UPI002A75E289|nr:hypothetical protein [Chryseobacterium sp. JJR-5R]WPO81851.1 hypothetical protein SD427_13865 [Chryseobacterium sp. JJR-5R]
MIDGFENAGFNKKSATETAENSTIYQVPTKHGNVNVRAMEGNSKNTRRSVFTDGKIIKAAVKLVVESLKVLIQNYREL